MDAHILIAICTRKREQLLTRCLHHVALLAQPKNIRTEILIVYNGNEDYCATQSVINQFNAEHAQSATLICETQLGIPYARNTALDYANARGYSHLAFLDDDDFPDSQWLVAICATLESNGGFAAAGPQMPIFPAATSLVQQGCMMHGARVLDQGAQTMWAATNNVIFSLSDAAKFNLRFAESFVKTGGSDKLFFQQLCFAANKKISWAKHAIVYQTIPTERLTLRWVLSRAYRTGTTEYLTEKTIHGRGKALAKIVYRANSRFYGALLDIVYGISNNERYRFLNSGCGFMQGIGCITGVLPFFRRKSYI